MIICPCVLTPNAANLHTLNVTLLEPPRVVRYGVPARLLMKRVEILTPDNVERAAGGVYLVKNLIPVWHRQAPLVRRLYGQQ